MFQKTALEGTLKALELVLLSQHMLIMEVCRDLLGLGLYGMVFVLYVVNCCM